MARWVGLVLLTVVIGLLLLSLLRIWRAAAALRADIEAARDLMEGEIQSADLPRATSILQTTREDLQSLQGAARPFLWAAPHLGWIPRYGPTIQAAPLLLDVAADLALAAELMVDPLISITEQSGGDVQSEHSITRQASRILVDARPQFSQALASVQRAGSSLAALDVDALHPRLQGGMEELDRYLPLLEQGARVGLLAPDMLGAGGRRTYLLLVQNEDELRATGGFISAVATMTLADGQIAHVAFEDSYAVDDFSQPYPDPPAALREVMLADLWVFRDSNWSPDFPTSARKAVELFSISRDVHVDGVVALDQRAISLLLDPLGPLQVQGADEPITGQNVLQVARRAWAEGASVDPNWWLHRKDIMGSVLDAALQRLTEGVTRDQMLEMGYAGLTALRERHVLLYLDDQSAANHLHRLGWDGALAQPAGDYLMVVDANVGFNKVNAVVEESLDYAVDLNDPAQIQATLTVGHSHPVDGWQGPCSQEPRYGATYQDLVRRCYYDYLRVYVPSQADLRRATPHPVPGSILVSGERQQGEAQVYRDEMHKTVFATLLVLRPGESLDTTFEYVLPPTVLERVENGWRYRLTVQKQPGTEARPIQVTLALPDGAEVVSANPSPDQRSDDVLTYAADLRTDLRLDVAWRLGGPE